MAYSQQPNMVGLPTPIPGAQTDLTAYSPMQPATYAFGGQQYQVPYQGQMMGHQGQSYPSPLAPSLIGMNTAQAAAAAVRTSVGPQNEGTLSLYNHDFVEVCQGHFCEAVVIVVRVPTPCSILLVLAIATLHVLYCL